MKRLFFWCARRGARTSAVSTKQRCDFTQRREWKRASRSFLERYTLHEYYTKPRHNSYFWKRDYCRSQKVLLHIHCYWFLARRRGDRASPPCVLAGSNAESNAPSSASWASLHRRIQYLFSVVALVQKVTLSSNKRGELVPAPREIQV